MSEQPTVPKKRGLSFTAQIVVGLLLGLFAGVFFGDSIAGIGALGTAYVRLLQMTILPYIMVSLIQGFGRLTREQALRVAPRLALIMLVFWCVGLTLVVVMPSVFPNRQSAAFFNPSVLDVAQKPSFVDLFIPSNPFQALAAGTIPAVVLFSILFGTALMGLPGKDGFLRNLDLVAQALTRVAMIVMKTTPIGVFAMTAAAAGTMELSEIARLQVYFTTYIGASLFLALFVFPMLVGIFTPFTYRQLFRRFKAALVMAFTTGNLFVVLPLLMEQTKRLFEERDEMEGGEEYVEILVPVAFNFPNMGKLIALLFVLFGAWFVGSPIAPATYPKFLATGWVTFFGGIDLALPFMLSMQNLPADLFQIYSVSGVINGRFATLLACMELICITLIVTTWLASPSGLKIRFRSLAMRAALIVVGFALMLLPMKLFLDRIVPTAADHRERLETMALSFRPEGVTVYKPGTALPPPRGGAIRLFGKKEAEEVLRVGYLPDHLPFSYFNRAGRLVGYDVDLVVRMARDLDMQIEFYPTTLAEMGAAVNEGRLDLMISGITLSTSQIKKLGFTEPYRQLTLGAVLTKERKRDLLKARKNDELKFAELKIAVVTPNPYLEAFRAALPKSEFIFIDSPRTFYDADPGTYDLLLTSLEGGAAWNMLYPDFTTLIIKNGSLKKELVFAADPKNEELIRFVDDWLRLQKSQGLMDRLYDYWIRGLPRPNEKKPRRWCIMRNVLGWGRE